MIQQAEGSKVKPAQVYTGNSTYLGGQWLWSSSILFVEGRILQHNQNITAYCFHHALGLESHVKLQTQHPHEGKAQQPKGGR